VQNLASPGSPLAIVNERNTAPQAEACGMVQAIHAPGLVLSLVEGLSAWGGERQLNFLKDHYPAFTEVSLAARH